MRIVPSTSRLGSTLKGKVKIHHYIDGFPEISEYLEIEIFIPNEYPKSPPIFKEIGGCIQHIPKNHINGDGSLCLGSPFRLLQELNKNNCFLSFYNTLFIPYAYAVLLRIRYDINFIFGELSHGDKGEFEDFMSQFRSNSELEVLFFLKYLSLKKRVANKLICPCGCKKKLRDCPTHNMINKFRNIPRCWYRETFNRLTFK